MPTFDPDTLAAIGGTDDLHVSPLRDDGVTCTDELIDAAYEAKYHGSPYLPPMLTAKPTMATVKISPR